MTAQFERDKRAWQADQDEKQRKLADHDRLSLLNAELLAALIMVRDADNDCIKDGLQRIPDIPRGVIDRAIAKASQ